MCSHSAATEECEAGRHLMLWELFYDVWWGVMVALSLSLSLSREAIMMMYNVLTNSKTPTWGMWLEEGE